MERQYGERTLEKFWEECLEPLRDKEPFALCKEDEIVCIYHFPVGAVARWELLFQPRLAKVIYRSQSDDSLPKLTTVANGLLRGVLGMKDSTAAAYGELLSAVKGSSGLAVMERQEVYLQEMLRATLCLNKYLQGKRLFPMHKQKVPQNVVMCEKNNIEPEYQAILNRLVQLYRKGQWDFWMKQQGLEEKEIFEENILRYMTATLFLLMSQMQIPVAYSQKRYECYCQLQENMKETVCLYLHKKEKEKQRKMTEWQNKMGLPLYILESREANEARIPLRKRLEGDIQSVDIAAIACLSLFSNKRHIMDQLLERGIPVRLVITDKEQEASKFVFSQFVDSSSDTEREDILHHVYSAIQSRKKYSNLHCRKTGFLLPTAIFIVHEKEREKSSAKVDIYGFDTFDDDRRTLYITGEDQENFEYFVRQFEYIWQRAVPMEEAF